MTYEHEAMHAETLLYMLAQSPLTRPPTATSTPEWATLAKLWAQDAAANPNKVLTMAEGVVELGHDDLEAEDAKFTDHNGWENHELGWDNEHPKVATRVGGFKVDSLVISNNDYLAYLKASNADFTNTEAMPASWHLVDGIWHVRTLYGPISFDVAGLWPLMASKLEIEAYARSKGGRLPTEPELRRLWDSEEGPRPAGLLANVGFRNWHPIPYVQSYVRKLTSVPPTPSRTLLARSCTGTTVVSGSGPIRS